MKRVPLYSRSQRPAEAEAQTEAATPGPSGGQAEPEPTAITRRARAGRTLLRHERRLWALALIALAAAFWFLNPMLVPKAPLTIEQIDAAMRQSIEEKPLASAASRAYDAIIPSVVRVVGLMSEGDDGNDDKEHGNFERGVGTGVVIIDNGTILTNLHVVAGAKTPHRHLPRWPRNRKRNWWATPIPKTIWR